MTLPVLSGVGVSSSSEALPTARGWEVTGRGLKFDPESGTWEEFELPVVLRPHFTEKTLLPVTPLLSKWEWKLELNPTCSRLDHLPEGEGRSWK